MKGFCRNACHIDENTFSAGIGIVVKPAAWIRANIVVLGVLATATAPHAGEPEHRLQVPVDIKPWIERLTDRAGMNCCSDADGVKPQEVDWDISKNHYRVKLGGEWIEVPDIAVVRGPNYLGHAVVWIYEEPIPDPYVDSPYVRCFLPGPAS